MSDELYFNYHLYCIVILRNGVQFNKSFLKQWHGDLLDINETSLSS